MRRSYKIKFTSGQKALGEARGNYSDLIQIPAGEIPPGADTAEIFLDEFCADRGDDGFFIIPNPHPDTNRNTALTFFKERPDCEFVFPHSNMPVFAVSRNGKAVLAVVTGMPLDYALVAGVRNGKYYLRPRFALNGEPPPEDIEIRFFRIEDADATYSGIARRYRKFQLERGACVPLKERMRRFPVLEESAKGPMVRLRMAWKAVPPPVLEQTEENEPPIHAAITFKRAEDIIEEFHRQGIEHAEFCLVGWNKSGHDGRFPDLFPVEPLLGGEEALKSLINKARSYGYLISAHTNVLDSYTIAKRWRKEDMLLDKDGGLVKGGQWGGGQSYFVCPEAAHKNYAVQDMDDMARLGFRGTHYFDVMTILPPEPCFNPAHPLSRRKAGEWRGRSMALAREKIGAVSSEGSYDFCIGDVDYVLYAVFNRTEPLPEICDKYIPFWHIVYHGIVTYNTFTDSVNAMIKADKTLALENYECGGRPLAYFYSKFLSSGAHWMGDDDLTCDSDERLRDGVAAIKADYDRYRTIDDLQFEFIEEHKEISDKVSAVTYSSGDVLIVNRSEKPFKYQGITVKPLSFQRISSR